MKKIELTDFEKKVIGKQLDGTFEEFFAPDEEKRALMSVIDKAYALMEETDAYEESGDDVIAWFWRKYQEQEAKAKEA